jgi:predicted PurR-regulated permease PerM
MQNEISLWIKKIMLLLLIAGFCYIFYVAREIFFIVMISGFLTIIVNPLVDTGEKYKIPAWVTIIAVFVLIFLL